MALYFLSYIAIPVALIVMFRHYQKSSWAWLACLAVGIPSGIAPFIAIGYLLVAYLRDKPEADETAVYYPDGSYVKYHPIKEDEAPSAGRVAFRVVLSILGVAAMLCGLFIVAILLSLSSAASSGSKSN